jgi:tetratricopeptide (TPR) repeat protein
MTIFAFLQRHRIFVPAVFSQLLVLAALFSPGHPAFAAPNTAAWQLYMDNNLLEAHQAFLKNIDTTDAATVKNALVGLAFVNSSLGRQVEAGAYFFKSGLIDYDPCEFIAGMELTMVFGRSAAGYTLKDGYRMLKKAAQTPSIFNGVLTDMLIERLLADGKIRAATRLTRQLNPVRTWQCIGPFDNTSNAGYSNVYPPETEIDFSREYTGKDGNLARWFPLTVRDHRGWLFMENHTTSGNAVYYLYCTIQSPVTRKVRLAFGASGTFKIFLNRQLVLADSVYRNTGNDAFIQLVTLRQGDNTLLVKLGHENMNYFNREPRFANFILRFLGPDYTPLPGLTITTAPAAPPPGTDQITYLRPTLILDSCAAVLRRRIAADSCDLASALLLARLYNVNEVTDSAQILCEHYLRRYPRSAALYQLYSETLGRAQKKTQTETAIKTAYRLSPLIFPAWLTELEKLNETGNAQNVLEFIRNSPAIHQSSVTAHLYRLRAYFNLENRSAASDELARLEKQFPYEYQAVVLLAQIYARMGMSAKADKMLRQYLAHDRNLVQGYTRLLEIAIASQRSPKAMAVIQEGLRYNPEATSLYHAAALILYNNGKAAAALPYNEQHRQLMPASANALNLGGSILATLGQTAAAHAMFQKTIALTNDDFTAWENLRALDHKPILDSLAPLPNVDSLVPAGNRWQPQAAERGAVLAYCQDVFYYPSHCSRERNFYVVRLPTQKAVDAWKEYSIRFNRYYQEYSVQRAVSLSVDGRETPADVDRNEIVFKSLRPGDCIVLEYSLYNYYTGAMAQQVYGSEDFHFALPVLNSRVRFITPALDTIPYRVFGDSLRVATIIRDDYRVTTVAHPPSAGEAKGPYLPDDWPGKNVLTYTTLPHWQAITSWYQNLTRNKMDNSLELTALADSLFTTALTPDEKARRVHDFIISSIQYSFVPFRQSGWIPQDATTVLATRIGDCKDMASLARQLLIRGGLAADLVLVNTQIKYIPDHAYVSPDFNHCIVSYMLADRRHFMDCTDGDLAFGYLPKNDQGALALVINDSTRAPILLPVDSAAQRYIKRSIEAIIDTSLTMRISAQSTRNNIQAASMRERYRFISAAEQRTELQKSLSNDYSQVTLDSFSFTSLSPETDTLTLTYSFSARDAATLNGTTVIVPLQISDNITARSYPTAEKRNLPIDMSNSFCNIGTFISTKQLTYPAAWRPVTIPAPTEITSPWGSYQLTFSHHGNTIICNRNAIFRFYGLVPAEHYDALKSFMSRIAQADKTQLLFYTQ